MLSLTAPQECVQHATEAHYGWPQKAYNVSKASINALTAVLARKYRGIAINACCPGWVSTDMGRMVGSSPSKAPGMRQASTAIDNKLIRFIFQGDGATIPIRLAFSNIGQVTGRYWANPSVSGRGEGQVMEW